MTITLPVAIRDENISAKAVRAAAQIPAVVYGPKHPSQSITIEKSVFEKVIKTAGESTVISLTGLAKPTDVLIHQVDYSAAKGGIIHVDFYALEKGKSITAHVGLEFIGEAPVEETGGLVSKVLYEVTVTSMAESLPAHITVDLSTLTAVDQKIHISDLVVPKGVVIENGPEEVVAMATAERIEEVSDEMPAVATEESPAQTPEK